MVTPERLNSLFRTYHQPLVRFLVRQTGDSDWAEEVAQETFVRALEQDSIASERSWIFAVAMNLVRDEARRDARRRKRLELMTEEAKAEAVVDPGPTTMERDEERALARQAVDALAERDRDALLRLVDQRLEDHGHDAGEHRPDRGRRGVGEVSEGCRYVDEAGAVQQPGAGAVAADRRRAGPRRGIAAVRSRRD